MVKKTNILQEALLEQLRKTPVVQIACEKLNITRMTYYRWKKEDKNFARRADEALYDGALLVNDLAESQLIGAIKDRNMYAVMAWLRHHHPDYTTKVKIEGTVVQECSPEQRALIENALRLAGKFDDHETEEK